MLVIIGLIIGAIIVGREMIRASELRSILSDAEKFRTAVNTYRLKYNCLPGDCANATTFLGVDSAGCPAGGGATGTCNGDGNGHIDYFAYESFQAWKQLALVDLINGKFSGTDASWQARLDINIPSSKLLGVGYSIGYFNPQGNTNPAWMITGQTEKNRIAAGRECVNQMNCASFITAKESFALDTKTDDGNPASGSITSLQQGYRSPDTVALGSCWFGVAVQTAAYNFIAPAADQENCTMVFAVDF